MKKIFKAALSLPVLMLVSCESMDIKPNSQGNSETWYSTEQELQMAANRFYTIGYWNSPYQDTEQWTDNFTYRTTNRHPDNGAPLNGNLNGEDYIVYHMWEQAYKLIAQANLLLTHSGRAKANGVSEDVVNRYRAEAYFARACKYAELISYFGDVPYVDKPLTIAESEVLKRMPKDQLIPKVYDDFDHAIDSLPVSYDKLKRFTKGAAMAMKARFALYMGDWKTAAEAAEACIGLDIYSLDSSYEHLFLQTTKENPEKILSFPRSVALGVKLDEWFVNNQLPRLVSGYGASNPSWDLLASYLCTDGLPIDESELFEPKDPFKNRDPRCSMTIVPFGSEHVGYLYEPYSPTAHKANGEAAGNNPDCRFSADPNALNCSYNGLLWKKGIDDSWLLPDGKKNPDNETDFVMMRYADVLLMYAEAKIELGEADQKILDATINKVRARAYSNGTYPRVLASDQKTMRKALRIERRMEFANENLRYMDLIRWRLSSTFENSQVDKYDPLNSPNYIFPAADELEDIVTGGRWFWDDVVPDIDENGIPDLSPLVTAGLAQTGAPRVFPKRQILWPIPTHDGLLNPALGQNDGYTGENTGTVVEDDETNS